MATKTYRPTNGVSFGLKYTVTADDDTDGVITFDFGVGYQLAAAISVTSAAGVNVALSDAVITYPAGGQVRIADGAATFAVTATDIITVVAQRASAIVS
jgi:hypothetical protein